MRKRERQGWERKIEREARVGERERKIGRETGVGQREMQGRKREREGERERYRGEREGETGRKRETDSGEREKGEKEKNYKHKKFMEFYLVVLQSGYLLGLPNARHKSYFFAQNQTRAYTRLKTHVRLESMAELFNMKCS